MKGHTTIELTNVRTQEHIIREDDNMFTNALDALINDHEYMSAVTETAKSELLPIATRALGGIFLFDRKLEEDPNKFYPPTAPLAYAGDSTAAAADTRRGIYNAQESGPIDNGYKHVWDFSTNRGNGTIACACLTNYAAGNEPFKTLHVSASNYGNTFQLGQRNVCMDSEQGIFACHLLSDKAIEIRQYRQRAGRVSLTAQNGAPQEYEVLKKLEIPNVNSEILWDMVDDTAIGIWAKGARGGKTDIYRYEISRDYTMKESTIQIDGSYRVSEGTIRGKYLFLIGNTVQDGMYPLYKIDTDNPTDIKEICKTYVGALFTDRTTGLFMNKTKSRRIVVFPDDTSAIYEYAGSYSNDTVVEAIDPVRAVGLYGSSTSSSSSSNLANLMAPTYYLATINNLQEPITKTAEQTMKITYTITEED